MSDSANNKSVRTNWKAKYQRLLPKYNDLVFQNDLLVTYASAKGLRLDDPMWRELCVELLAHYVDMYSTSMMGALNDLEGDIKRYSDAEDVLLKAREDGTSLKDMKESVERTKKRIAELEAMAATHLPHLSSEN